MSTVKLTNGVLVDLSSLKICPDLSNQLTSLAAGASWTATQDCWVCFDRAGGTMGMNGNASFDGTNVFYAHCQGINENCYFKDWLLAKKGTVIENGYRMAIRCYGVK